MNSAMVDALMARRQATIYVAVIRQHNQLLVRTSDEKTMQQIRELVQRVDVPTPLVLLEVKILSVNLGDDFNSVFDYQFSDGATIAGGFVPSSLIAPPSPAFTTGNILPPAGTTAPLTRDTPLGPGAVARRRRQSQSAAVVPIRQQQLPHADAVAGKQQSRDHAGHAAALDGQQRGQPAFRRAGSAAEPGIHRAHADCERRRDLDRLYAGSTNIQFRPVGTDLLITPNINADRTVTLRILQEVSNIIKAGADVYLPPAPASPSRRSTSSTRRASAARSWAWTA